MKEGFSVHRKDLVFIDMLFRTIEKDSIYDQWKIIKKNYLNRSQKNGVPSKIL